jgi:hypothetical protein
MTFIGKLFLCVNLVLSLAMATAGFAAFSSGVDWSDNAAKGAQPAGKLVAKKAEVADLGKQLALAFDSWKVAGDVLTTREDERRVERVWYTAELAKLFEPKNVQIVSPDKPGETTGRPTLVPGVEIGMVPLMGMAHYIAKLQEHRDENVKIRTDLEAKIKEDTDLTTQLTGDPERKTRGLRRTIVEEREKRLGIIEEAGLVEGLRVNRMVEAELILKRLEAIEERVRELTTYLKKVHDVDVTAKDR